MELGIMTEKSAKIFVAGHRGLVGSTLVRHLVGEGYTNLLIRSRSEVDLQDEAAVQRLFRAEQPDVVVIAAARVGGIKANTDYPVEFLRDNLELQNNVIRAAHEHGVRKLLFLASSCIYPREASQ